MTIENMVKNQLKTGSPIESGMTKENKDTAAADEAIYEQRAREEQISVEAMIRRLNSLLSDYKMMPDSFIMPELYQQYKMINGERVFVELEKAKKNKLITGWFTNAFKAAADAEDLLEIKSPESRNLFAEFMALLKKEDELAQVDIQQESRGKKIAELTPDEAARIFKTAKRKAAFEYIDNKVVILKKLESLMRRLVDDLRALKYQQAA